MDADGGTDTGADDGGADADGGTDTGADDGDADGGTVDDASDSGADPGTGDDQPADAGDDGSDDIDADDDLAPPPATEVLLFDGDGLQFTDKDNGFHNIIEPGDDLPADDWLSPVDYYHGEFHIRYTIQAPADQAAGKLQTCIWTMGDDGVGGNYFPENCGQQVAHQGVGAYEVTSRFKPAEWWKKDGVPVDFSHPERFLLRVVLRGVSGCNVTRYDVADPCWEDWPLYEHMAFRVTLVMVGAGESFSGWDRYP